MCSTPLISFQAQERFVDTAPFHCSGSRLRLRKQLLNHCCIGSLNGILFTPYVVKLWAKQYKEIVCAPV